MITTPMTFVATLNTIVHCGAVPVLADIDATTLNIRVEEIEKKIGPKTRAIVPVHYVGQPADLDPILDAARPRAASRSSRTRRTPSAPSTRAGGSDRFRRRPSSPSIPTRT